MNHRPSPRIAFALACLSFLASCITTDADGNPVPRGNQHYTFDEVTERVDRLKRGQTKLDVLLLLGSPAERDERGDRWVYLPERPGLLIPARALLVEFKNGRLTDHGYHAIVLGTRL